MPAPTAECLLLTHNDDGAALMEGAPDTGHDGRALLDDGGDLGVEGVGEADVADDAVLEEGEGADALCAVDDLVGDDKVHGADVLLQGADGAEGDDGAHAEVAQGGDVGAGGHLVGGQLVVQAVAGQEGDGHAVVLEDLDRRRGETPGRLRVDGCHGRVAVDLGQAGAANDGDVDGPWGAGVG